MSVEEDALSTVRQCIDAYNQNVRRAYERYAADRWCTLDELSMMQQRGISS